MRLATLRQGAAVLEDDAAYLLPTSLAQLIELGLERALEVGEQTPPPLEPGDVVRMEVEGIGTLTGSVAQVGRGRLRPCG